MAQALGYATHINTNTTTVCKRGMGMFLFVTINALGGTGSTATVYDGVDATGTLLAVIDTSLAMGTLGYEVLVTVGLTVVTAGGTPADLTISSSQ
jgi:hypothetical protein